MNRPTKKQPQDPLPRNVRPMLATLAGAPFDRPHWLFEVKWDGYRAIAEIENGAVQLYSRSGVSFNRDYPNIGNALASLPHDCVLDGEIVALKEGRPDFHALQQHKDVPAPLQYIVFDLLYLDGHDVQDRPLSERKALLKTILPKSHPLLLFSAHVETAGIKFFQTVITHHLEGLVAKDAQSRYQQGTRSTSWLKVKHLNEQEAIIVGFTQPRGSRKNLGALVLGAYEEGKLVYIGHSGGGFTEAELHHLCRELKKIEVTRSPFPTKVPVNAPVTWVKPQYVANIKFTEWTPEGRMRHPIFAGIRRDKEPREVVRELPNL